MQIGYTTTPERMDYAYKIVAPNLSLYVANK